MIARPAVATTRAPTVDVTGTTVTDPVTTLVDAAVAVAAWAAIAPASAIVVVVIATIPARSAVSATWPVAPAAGLTAAGSFIRRFVDVHVGVAIVTTARSYTTVAITTGSADAAVSAGPE